MTLQEFKKIIIFLIISIGLIVLGYMVKPSYSIGAIVGFQVGRLYSELINND